MNNTLHGGRFSIAAIIFAAALFLLATLGAVESQGVIDESEPKQKPNVVILFADNLAYNDVGAFQSDTSSTSRTPRTDALATDGLKLLHWNSPAVLCSASRAALLTGKYPVRTGVYPRVFEPDAKHGLMPDEITLADHLKEEGYATKIVGKWHLGSRPGYLPTDRGFDEWFGIPYHMSGGSLDGHVCGAQKDPNGTNWLPLFDGQKIVEQPVDLTNLAPRYVDSASQFIHKHAAGEEGRPFFLYMAFSHVHQLCAPRFHECQWASEHFSREEGSGFAADFGDAVEEMDWVLGGVMDALKEAGVYDDTIIIFTSDNGPWTAERSCAGSKGQFEGTWLKQNVDVECTACPSEYVHSPLPDEPRRCVYPGTEYEVEGVHCGEDSGLGSAWEANVRMPAIVRWKGGQVPIGKESYDMVSTLDVLPTVLSMIGKGVPKDVDGVDVKDVFLGQNKVSGALSYSEVERPIFFWRDGFQTGPLPPPFGRFDVVAIKLGWIKLWFWTKSSHYNDDPEVYHNPPLLFDVLNDPAEAFPLDPEEYRELIDHALSLVVEHKASVDWTEPLTLARDSKYLPCSNAENGCRTSTLSPEIGGEESIISEE